MFRFFALQWAMCSNLEKEHTKEYIITIMITTATTTVKNNKKQTNKQKTKNTPIQLIELAFIHCLHHTITCNNNN